MPFFLLSLQQTPRLPPSKDERNCYRARRAAKEAWKPPSKFKWSLRVLKLNRVGRSVGGRVGSIKSLWTILALTRACEPSARRGQTIMGEWGCRKVSWAWKHRAAWIVSAIMKSPHLPDAGITYLCTKHAHVVLEEAPRVERRLQRTLVEL